MVLNLNLRLIVRRFLNFSYILKKIEMYKKYCKIAHFDFTMKGKKWVKQSIFLRSCAWEF